MCNRFWQEHQLEKIARVHEATLLVYDNPPRSEVYPGYQAATIVQHEGVREVRSMHWGFIPPWVKDDGMAKFMKPNNARDDTALKNLAEKKGMSYAAMKSSRCIIPASAWCEWTREKGKKVANRLTVKGHEVISFAGLYTYRKDFPGESCTMMTTAAEGCAMDYHHRIPVILRGEEEIAKWLNPATDLSELVPLFRCIPEELFEARVYG